MLWYIDVNGGGGVGVGVGEVLMLTDSCGGGGYREAVRACDSGGDSMTSSNKGRYHDNNGLL